MLMKKYSLAQLVAIYATYKDLDPKTKTVKCCTCGKTIQINEIEDCFNIWGHYIARSLAPKLKYHPLNSFAQCVFCNAYSDYTNIQEKYDNYMKYRFGDGIKEQLLSAEVKDEEYYKDFYITELIKLSNKFPELLDIVIDKNTGEIKNEGTSKNKIEEQFDTYSPTFKSDLDTLCKCLKTDFVEYNRL